jgi:hypothetical protein
MRLQLPPKFRRYEKARHRENSDGLLFVPSAEDAKTSSSGIGPTKSRRPVLGQFKLAWQLLRDGMAYNKPSSPTVEISQSLGEWVVRIVGTDGNTYSRAFESKPDAVTFAEEQRLRLALQSPTPN